MHFGRWFEMMGIVPTVNTMCHLDEQQKDKNKKTRTCRLQTHKKSIAVESKMECKTNKFHDAHAEEMEKDRMGFISQQLEWMGDVQHMCNGNNMIKAKKRTSCVSCL